MSKPIGTVISSPDSPSTYQFNFVINDSSKLPVRKGQFVQLETEEGTILARVDEIFKTNRYFMQAEAVREYERSGKPLLETFPVDRWEYLVARTTSLGVYSDGMILRVAYPPSPGSTVEVADENILSDFLGFDKKGLNIGKVAFHDLDAKLNLTRLFQKHLAILAMSGAGKCLSPKTLISLSNGEMIPVCDLVDSIISTNKIDKEGDIEFAKVKNLKVLTLKNNKISVTKVKAVTRRKSPIELIKIKTQRGKELVLTKEHPILTFDDKIIWKEASKFKNDDWVALPSIIPSDNHEIMEINVIKELKDKNGFYAVRNKGLINKLKDKIGLNWKAIAKKLNVPYTTLLFYKDRGSIPINKLLEFGEICQENVIESIKEIKYNKKGTTIPSHFKIDKNFARFLGYMFGDGHNDSRTLRFTNSNEVIINDFCELSNKLFKKVYKRRKQRGNTQEIIIFNRTAAITMDKIFGIKKSARIKNIPNIIMKSRNDVIKNFLKALFDCDGYCNPKKPEIELALSNKKIIPKIENLLLRFNIIVTSKIKSKQVRNGKRDYFYLYIRGVDNLNKFMKIGFGMPRKMEVLKSHLYLKSNTNIDVVPYIPAFSSALNEIRISQTQLAKFADISQSAVSRYISGNLNFSKNTFKKVVNGMKILLPNSKRTEELEKMSKLEIFWDKIEDIEVVKSEFNYVYDLVLEDSHNFIANNVIVHNSHLCSVFIEELLDRSEEMGKPAIILIDPHGEYKKFANDPKYANRTKVFNKNNLSIAVSSLSPYQIAEFLPEVSPTQVRELIKIIKTIKKKNYDFKDLIEAVEKSDIKKNIKEPIISWLDNLAMSRLFSNLNKPGLNELAKSGQLSILDISDFVRLTDKQIIVTFFARQLFNVRRQNIVPPFIFIVEEAHQFCPEKTEKHGAISKGIIQTIAREGRKFYASLVLISQRPIHLSTTALSQCNTHIILRVTNPYDLDHIGQSSEGITRDVLNMISGLRVGEALIVGEAVNYPLLVTVRDRKSKKSDKGSNLEDVLKEYNKSEKRTQKDIETFM